MIIPGALKPLLRPIADLTEYPRNAQKHTDEDVAAFGKVLAKFGWTNPIVAWQKGDVLYISAGHLRYRAAKAIGLDAVPVLIRSDWTEAEFRAYTIADNQWTKRATYDIAILKDELVDLDTGEFDLALTGFERNEVYALVHGKGQKGLDDAACEDFANASGKKTITLTVGLDEYDAVLQELEGLVALHDTVNVHSSA